MARRMSLFLIALVLALAAAGYGVLHYMTAVPGKPHRGPLPPLAPEEAMFAQSLARHIATIAPRASTTSLITRTRAGRALHRGDARVFRLRRRPPGIFDRRQTGAQHRGRGRAGRSACRSRGDRCRRPLRQRIRLARRQRQCQQRGRGHRTRALVARSRRGRQKAHPVRTLRQRGAALFQDRGDGQLNYAGALARRNERGTAMYSLETIGFYSREPGSQVYPAPFGLMFPDRGDFVAFVGMLGSRALVWQTVRSFRSHTAFPTIGGVAPGFIPGIG